MTNDNNEVMTEFAAKVFGTHEEPEQADEETRPIHGNIAPKEGGSLDMTSSGRAARGETSELHEFTAQLFGREV